MKRILIVSPHFPPVNAPDMQRVRMSLPYYGAGGWEAVVLAVGDRWQDAVREPELAATLPIGLRVVFTRALPLAWTRRLGIGNLGLRAWPHLYRAGSRLLRRENFDLVFFSNTQFITFALGPLWRRRHGVPYVLDFQDPWRTDHYEQPGARPPPGGWKYRLARLQARLLEGWAVTRASGLMSVSPLYLEALRARYPRVEGTPSAVLEFGASRLDLARARELPLAGGSAGSPAPRWEQTAGRRHLLYTGAAGPVSPRAFELFFDALAQYRSRDPARGNRLRIHFVGTSYAPPGRGRPSVLPLAEAAGVADLIDEMPHRIGFLEAARLQQEADALLLLASSDPAYAPSKLFIYYLTEKPIVALTRPDSVMERLLRELSCAWVVPAAEAGPAAEAAAGLHRFFDALIEQKAPDLMPRRRPGEFDARYSAEDLARRQCELFEAALAAP